jgi:ligand-binding sensor domain-containing protein
MVCSLIPCSILLITYNSFPQSKDIRFEHLTVKDGLPTNTIWNITQDHLGFMWFTTSNGLVKYDGYKFTTYQPVENDSNSIYTGDLCLPYEDPSQNLWIAHYNGMSLYNRETDSFTNYLFDPDADGTYNNIFFHIIEDHTGTLWVGKAKGVLRLVDHPEMYSSYENIVEKSYVHDPEDSTSIFANDVWTLYEDKSGILWLGTDKGLYKYNNETDNFTRFKTNKKEYYYDRVYSILEDSKNNFWIGTMGRGLAKFDRKSCEFEFISFTGENVYGQELPKGRNYANNLMKSILEDYDGTFWIPTSAGLINFNPISKKFSIFIHDPANPHSLSSGGDYAHSIYRDHSNVYWVSSEQGGLNRFSKDKQFRHIIYNQSDPQGLSNRTVSCIYEDKEGIIWIGTGGGILNKYDRNTNNFTHYPIIALNDNSVVIDYVRCILEDSDGLLWIGMHLGGLYRFEKSTGQFTHFSFDPKNTKIVIDNRVTSIAIDEFNKLWIGSGSGYGVLKEFNRHTGEFYRHRKYSFGHGTGDSVSTRNIFDMYLDKDGIIWFVSSFGSLNMYNPVTGKGRRFKFDKLSGEFILFSIYEDRQNRIWIGRDSGGLLRFDKQSESYKIYRIKDGLPDETVGAILEDDNGYLWMRTGTSICKFNPEDETFKIVYKLYQGFQRFNCWRAWKSKLTGEMFFPGDDGFYIFHPDSVKGNLIPPKIVLTDFQIFDETVQIGKDSPLKKHINIADEVILEHWQNDFSIEFAALHYTNPAENQHKYKLSGYEDDWRTADVNRLAKYTNMSPGEYVIRVIGSNSDGIWNEEGASLKIIILPPWWATTWAYIVYAIIILSIIYFTLKLQLRRIRIRHDLEIEKVEAQKMHELDEMKSRFFANLSHEFRTPLTLILGPVKDILEKAKDAEIKQSAGVIRRNARRLYGLVNQLLDISKLEAGKMKLEASEQNIIPLLKGYVLSFSSLAERSHLSLIQ